MQQNTKVLALGTPRNPGRLRRELTRCGIDEWVGFIADYGVLLEVEAALSDLARRRPIARVLRDRVAALRRPYFTLTAGLAQKYQSLAWWSTQVADRQTILSDLFLHCCYLSVLGDFLKEGRNLSVVCDSLRLRSAIVRLARAHGYTVRYGGFHPPAFRETVLRPVLSLVRAFWTTLLRWLCVRLYRTGLAPPEVLTRLDILVNSWAVQGSVDAHGNFKDRFFPGLEEYYAARKLRSISVLTFIGGMGAFRTLVKRLGPDSKYILLERYVRLTDLLFPLRLWLGQLSFSFNDLDLEGTDVSSLFTNAKWTEAPAFVTALQYSLVRRLGQRGVRPRLYLTVYENTIPQKMAILAIRRFMPDTEIYGFCHMALKPDFLACYTDSNEARFAPLPDRIICNSERYRAILLREQYPAERLVVGAALRYAHLHKQSAPVSESRASDRRRGVLVVLTQKWSLNLELVTKLMAAVETLDVEVRVKPHPMRRDFLLTLESRFPGRAEVVEDSMEEAMRRADIIVTSASGTGLESALSGYTVVRVQSDGQLNMDPMAWFPEFPDSVATGEELRERLVQELGSKGRRVPLAHGIDQFFAPRTDKNMEAFLPGSAK